MCLLLQPAWLWGWPGWGNRHMSRKAGLRWACTLMETHLQSGDSVHVLYMAEEIGQLSQWGVSVGAQLQASVVQGEEAVVDILCTHCRHLYSGQRKTLPFTWVWGTGVLDIAMSWMLIHTGVHYLSASHLFYFLYEPNAAWHLVLHSFVWYPEPKWDEKEYKPP